MAGISSVSLAVQFRKLASEDQIMSMTNESMTDELEFVVPFIIFRSKMNVRVYVCFIIIFFIVLIMSLFVIRQFLCRI